MTKDNLRLDKLREASRRAGLISLLGTTVIIASLVYSSFKLESFQDATEQEKNKIVKMAEEKAKLQQEIEERSKELEKRKEDLLKVKVEEEAKPAPDLSVKATPAPTPLTARVTPTPTPPLPQVTGWAYYGVKNELGQWEERYFRKASGSTQGLPGVGDRIISISPVNMRTGYIKYDPTKGWTNEPAKGVIKPNQTFEILEVHPVLDNFIWVKIRRIV